MVHVWRDTASVVHVQRFDGIQSLLIYCTSKNCTVSAIMYALTLFHCFYAALCQSSEQQHTDFDGARRASPGGGETAATAQAAVGTRLDTVKQKLRQLLLTAPEGIYLNSLQAAYQVRAST